MIEIKGKYNTAKVFTDNAERKALQQIERLCNQKFCEKSSIRIMPDVHAGAGCTIGTTMTIEDTVVPNLVGVDIGCGMETIKTSSKVIDFNLLDDVINKYIPSGLNQIRSEMHPYAETIDLENLKCKDSVNINRARMSVGTLGGGNHFIEAARDDDGYIYIIVHSGSRYIGLQTAKYYQEKANQELIAAINQEHKKAELEIKDKLIKEGRKDKLKEELDKNIAIKKARLSEIIKDLAYLQGNDFKDYISDMRIIQSYADNNRRAMADIIVEKMKLTVAERFTTIHNYIDIESMILRKGAISARENEKVLIPINMRDGSLICSGKGNKDWNYSAPHGAGRIMSREEAKQKINLDEFQETMKGVFSTTVSIDTLDEAPMAYKPMNEIIKNIAGTVDIIKIIKPVYNFKAPEPPAS